MPQTGETPRAGHPEASQHHYDSTSIVSDYLTGLYGGEPDGFLSICVFKRGGRKEYRSQAFASIHEAAAFAVQLDAEGFEGVYHRATTLKERPAPGRRGDIEDSASVYFFALDMDVAGPAHKAGNYPADREQVEKILAEAGAPEPTAWVNSGHGYYPQWRFPEPLDVRDPEARQQVAESFNDLAERFIGAAKTLGFKLDNVRDLARVFRLPGTMNRKIEPVMATTESSTGPRYYLTELVRTVRKPQPVKPQAAVRPDDLFDSPSQTERDGLWTAEQAEREVERVLAGVTGTREGDGFNNVLNGAAYRIGRFVAGGFLEQDQAFERLEAACAVQFGSANDQDRSTVRSGLFKGMSGDAMKLARDIEPASSASSLDKLRARMVTRSQMDLIPPPVPLLGGILDARTVAFLSGKFGTYKTFLSVAWACSIATGIAWEGHQVAEPGPVIYIAAEGVSGISKRVKAWEKAFNAGQMVPDDRLLLIQGRVRLHEDDEIRDLALLAREIKPVMIVVDTLHACTPGLEENSSADMGKAFDALSKLRLALGCTVLVNHHTGHAGQRSRGSSSIEDDADTSWVIQLDDEEERGASNARTLKHRKTKDGELQGDMVLKFNACEETGSGYVTTGEDSAWLMVDAAVAKIRELGLGRNAGRDAIRDALKANGWTGQTGTEFTKRVARRNKTDLDAIGQG